MSYASLKKAELVALLQQRDAELLVAARRIEELRVQRAMAAPPAFDYRRPPAECRDYAAYVSACRKTQRAAGKTTISYLSFADWRTQCQS